MSESSLSRFRVWGLVALSLVVGASISAFVTISVMNNGDQTTDAGNQSRFPEAENSNVQKSERSTGEITERHTTKPQQNVVTPAYVDNPDETWNSLINDDIDDIAQLSALLEIAEVLVRREGIRALAQIHDSAVDSSVHDTIMKSVAQSAALDDPQSIFHAAMSLSRDVQDLVLPEIVKIWAGSDPLVAFDAISNLDKSGLRANLLDTLIGAWAENNPQDIFDSLDLLPERFRARAEELAMLAIARSSPADAVRFLENMGDSNKKRELAKTIAENWAKSDIYGALNWATSSQFSDERTKRDILSIVIRELADTDPELAMQTALNQPLYESAFGFESGLEEIVIEQVAKYDLDKAIGMLSQVRPGDTRIDAFNSVGRELVLNAEYDRALLLGEQLPGDERKRYLNTVLSLWAQEDPDNLLASIDSILTTPELKQQAAGTLLAHNFLNGGSILDTEQVDQLSSVMVEGEPSVVRMEMGDLDEGSVLQRAIEQGGTVFFPSTQRTITSSENFDPEEMQKSLQKSLEESLGTLLKDIEALGGDVEVKTEVKKSDKEDSD
ncbi:MAG: hypothetical protein F4Z01_01155 [Gammaproteobacteria bacterium]|nr:hypothetical protein [Gammaproteobacteria bacterium]MYF38471.1 hypothetical protein [Gammaproteobacteria bacterium]